MFGQDDNQDQSNVGVGANGPIFGQPYVPPANTDDAATSMPDSAPSAPAIPASPQFDSASTFVDPVSGPPVSDSNGGDLLKIKQDALQSLSPLISKLEQSPEEKFKTTMMMIQAADDQSLIQTAYDAANQITDEQAKAQALLDVVNEINYFTQQSSAQS